jgi:hypothetical protein
LGGLGVGVLDDLEGEPAVGGGEFERGDADGVDAEGGELGS